MQFPEIQNTYNGHEDPFYCKCTYCRKFWASTFGPLENFARSSPLKRSVATSTLLRQSGIIKVGDRIVVNGEEKGVVKFVGLLKEDELAPKTWIGVKLDNNTAYGTNGTFDNKSYFNCPNGHGVLVPYTDVRQLNPPEKKPPISGNEMFPSYETVRSNRRIRTALEEELYGIKQTGKIPSHFKINPSTDHSSATSSRPTTATSSMKKNADGFLFSSSKKESQTRLHRLRHEQKKFEQLKQEFGGGERGETLLKTFQKLQIAYEKGREILATEGSNSHS